MAFDDPRTLALLGASAGFLDPQGGMSAGFQGGLHGLMAGNQLKAQRAQSEMATRKLQRQMQLEESMRQLAEQHGSDPRAYAKALLGSGIPEAIKMGGDMLRSFGTKYLQSVDPEGNATYYAADNMGMPSPTGVPVASKVRTVNLGDRVGMIDEYSGKPRGDSMPVNMSMGERARLGQAENHFQQSQNLARENLGLSRQRLAMDMDPSFQAEKAATRQQALNRVQANKDLPLAVDKANESIQLIDDLVNHPGFKISVGKSAWAGKAASMVPGTDASDFARRMEQIKGQQFLQAFETLKGGGQITEIEGAKATQAISRMDTAQSEQEFVKAANEFKDIIQRGVNRAKKAAGIQQPSYSDGWGDLK